MEEKVEVEMEGGGGGGGSGPVDDAAHSLARTLTDGALSRYRTLAHGLPMT